MSLFLIPTLEATDMAQPYPRRTVTRGNSCGASTVRSPFDLIFGGDHLARHPFAVDDEEARYAAYEARLRQQQQLEEQRLQERYAALRRQAEVERERERRRIRAQHEQQQRRRQAALQAAAAAHAAWQEEQERQVRAALERQQQQQRRRQEALAAAERQRAWQQQQRLAQAAAARNRPQHSYDEQVAAAVAQEQWEEVAKQGLAVAFEFAKNLFGLEDDEEDAMQVDQQGKGNVAGPSKSATEVTATAAAPEKKEDVTDMISFEDPPEVALAQATVAAEQPQQKLVFTHPLPSDAAQRASIKADDIHVQYDDQSRSIVIRGLWQDNVADEAASSDSHTVTSSDDEEQSRGRKRSRSPKRSRVSDVDEKTGEEILQTDDNNTVNADGFVDVTMTKGKQAQGSARIPVPEGANVAGLRAELTDDGFQVWL